MQKNEETQIENRRIEAENEQIRKMKEESEALDAQLKEIESGGGG